MGVVGWFRSLFSSVSADEEAAEREEYGVADRGEAWIDDRGQPTLSGSESAELARDEIDALERPRDPAP
jgi:hypothetical protein